MRQDFRKEKKQPDIDKEVVLSHSYILKRIDGIVEIYYTGMKYDLHHFEEIDFNLKKLYSGEKLFVLNYTSPSTSTTAKARKYLAQQARSEFIKAEAIITHSLSQRLLVHFYLYINKPKIITNYFTDNEKIQAEKWLLSMK